MINYVDSDGDLCTIDNDRTLKVALKTVPSSSTLTLRIHHKASGSRSNRKNPDNQRFASRKKKLFKSCCQSCN